MSRRVIAAVLVAVLVVVAGCAGGGTASDRSGDGAAATTTATATPTTAESSDATTDAEATASSAGAAGVDPGEWEWFGFDEPATYTYDLYIEDEGEGTLVWDVTDVSADSVTVSITYELGETSFESTMTGDRETIRSQAMMTPAGPILMLTMFSPTFAYYEGQELAVGNQWSYAGPDGSLSFDVTGTDTVAGVDCYTTEMTLNGTVVHEACLSPELGAAPHAAYYEEDGTLTFELTLVDYERR